MHSGTKSNEENKYEEANEKTQRLHIPSVLYIEETAREENWLTGVYDPNDHYHQHVPEALKAYTDEIRSLRQYYSRILERYNLLKPKRLALAFDDNMMAHCNTEDDDHPEKPKRIKQAFETHQDYGILSRTEQGRS